MHGVSCMLFLLCSLQKGEREWGTAQRKTSLSVSGNPVLTLWQHEHEQALSFLTCGEKGGWTGAQGKRHNVWMPESGICIASTARTLTLRARCVFHALRIPFISAWTCAEQRK